MAVEANKATVTAENFMLTVLGGYRAISYGDELDCTRAKVM